MAAKTKLQKSLEATKNRLATINRKAKEQAGRAAGAAGAAGGAYVGSRMYGRLRVGEKKRDIAPLVGGAILVGGFLTKGELGDAMIDFGGGHLGAHLGTRGLLKKYGLEEALFKAIDAEAAKK